jgi:MoaA/NifB/PqqE/SkfB family radical SAM enzyme
MKNTSNNFYKKSSDVVLNLLRKRISKQTKKKLDWLEVHINEHCNLNCAYCTHYCPLAEEEYYDLDIFERDFRRMSELTDGFIKTIHLLGGEPLLNKNINKYMEIARKYFLKSEMAVVTNGILLAKMPENFWKLCKKLNIEIWISPYPIKLDLLKIQEISEKYKVNVVYSKTMKTMWKMPLNLEGTCDSIDSFKKCFLGCGGCYNIKNGKVYNCPVIPNIYHFNKYFNKNLQVTEDDYIDIYKAKNLEEIMDFLARPHSFCRYCDMKNTTRNHKWKVSKRDVSEWV